MTLKKLKMKKKFFHQIFMFLLFCESWCGTQSIQHQQQQQSQQQQQQHSNIVSDTISKFGGQSEIIGSGAGVRYDAPDDCRYLVTQSSDVSLICNLRTVNSEFDTTNFSVIPSEFTVSLTVLCNDEIMTKSSLEPRSFSHLVKLRDLQLEYCKFVKLGREVLTGLGELRNLTLRTHNINWPALSLEIESDAFVHTKNLEKLDLSRNNIWSLPENLFCPIHALNWLNISENRLQDINDLGFREKFNLKNEQPKGTNPCSLDLELLDISHNHFVLLPANGFGTLKRLRYLKVQNNEISMVADKAFGGLKNLQVIDLNSNKIVALPSELFQDPAQSIQEIYLNNNSISVLSPGLFSNLEQLQALDLSTNQLTSPWINRNTFSGLIRLVLLNLSNNKITKLEPEIFNDLYTLQILNLRMNQLEMIPADTFSPMNNLHTLLLSHNKIKYLDAYSLNGLYVLSLLSLDNNKLNGVHPEAFRNCSSLQDLNLNGNELTAIPLALKDMRLLKTVDLGENQIKGLEENGFRGMTNLYGLRLIGNEIVNVSKNAFKELPSLQILNLARNKIENVEKGSFEIIASIQAIRLDGNLLKEMDGLFTNMPNLLWLNMSDNQLGSFDFSQIPQSLQWLDLHKNDLEDLTNLHGIDYQLRLQTLDASFNRLQKIGPNTVPNNIELLFLNDNLITSIEAFTFKHKHNLTRVDLYANQITSLDLKSLRLDPIGDDKFLPEFYIGGNPFICDCNIDWLQKINHLTSRQYPRIMDLETIYCKLLYNRDRSYIQLIDAEPVHFLCTYKTHCFALCQCCEFDACDCEMTCPNNCTCFHDQSWSTNVVECSNSNYKDMPTNIPMDTTELYIDGNNLSELSGHSFIGRKNLKVLYANNSNIHNIYNTTFTGLKRLTILHLENNRVHRFIGNEFSSLENLKELYLQDNRINFINNQTFIELKRLEVLRLDGNRLTHFEVWHLVSNPYLVEIGLSDNMWSCECSYLSKFKVFLQSHGEKIFDSNKIACVYNNLTSIMKEKNGTKCTLKDGISTVVHSREIEDLLPLLLAATCAFVGFFGLIFGIFCYRRELKIWAHTHCISNMCYKSANFIDEYDKDRLYDAYITYSLQDEHFVNQILSSTLENDIGYRLCLHYRDFNMNTYIADTILEASESSKCTMIILSKNFLYNEWSRFEFKSAINEIIKRQRKVIFILYGEIPQKDIDHNMRIFLRTNTCIEWDDKKFWQKLRIVLPHLKLKKNLYLHNPPHAQNQHGTHHGRSPINIYSTSNDFSGATPTMHGANSTLRRNNNIISSGGAVGVGSGGGGGPVSDVNLNNSSDIGRLDYNNYTTLNNSKVCNRNCDNYDHIPPPSMGNGVVIGGQHYNTSERHNNLLNQNNLTTKSNKQHHNYHEYAVPQYVGVISGGGGTGATNNNTMRSGGIGVGTGGTLMGNGFHEQFSYQHAHSHSDCSQTSSSNEALNRDDCALTINDLDDEDDDEDDDEIEAEIDDNCFSYNCTNNCNCNHNNMMTSTNSKLSKNLSKLNSNHHQTTITKPSSTATATTTLSSINQNNDYNKCDNDNHIIIDHADDNLVHRNVNDVHDDDDDDGDNGNNCIERRMQQAIWA